MISAITSATTGVYCSRKQQSWKGNKILKLNKVHQLDYIILFIWFKYFMMYKEIIEITWLLIIVRVSIIRRTEIPLNWWCPSMRRRYGDKRLLKKIKKCSKHLIAFRNGVWVPRVTPRFDDWWKRLRKAILLMVRIYYSEKL